MIKITKRSIWVEGTSVLITGVEVRVFGVLIYRSTLDY